MGIARLIKVFPVSLMSVLVRCATANMFTHLRSMSVLIIGKIVVDRAMNVVFLLSFIVIIITAVVVRVSFVQLVAVCNADALTLLVSASYVALDRGGGFDAVFCQPLSVKLEKNSGVTHHRICRFHCTAP